MVDTIDRTLLRRIWNLTWPLVVYNVLEMSVGMADFLMVRPLGPAATAAMGVSRQVTFLVEGAAIAISTGVITLVSQSVGAGRHEQLNEIVRQSFRLVLLLGVPATVVGIFLAEPLVAALHASDQTLAQGIPYLQIYFAGLVFLWGNFVGTAIFRGAGDVWTPLKLALGVNLLNVALNYGFIYGVGPWPPAGVAGAAMGTIVARGCGALACAAILWRGTRQLKSVRFTQGTAGRRLLNWNWNWMRRILLIGVPMALAGLLRNGSRLVFLAIIGAGAAGVSFHAAVGVGLQLRLLGILPALAFQTATASLVGQAIGRGDLEEAAVLGRRSVLLLAVMMAPVAALVIALAEPLAALFIASNETARLASTVIRWFAVAQFFSALSITAQGALIGAGDTAPAMRYSLISQWFTMLPLAYLLLAVVGWVPHGPLAAWTIAPVISFILTWRRLRSGRWRTMHAVPRSTTGTVA